MKLATDIPLRADNTVKATVPGGEGAKQSVYTFRPDDGGQVTAEVTSDEHCAYLLDTGNFYPADEKDIGAGVRAVAGTKDASEGARGGEGGVNVAGSSAAPAVKRGATAATKRGATK